MIIYIFCHRSFALRSQGALPWVGVEGLRTYGTARRLAEEALSSLSAQIFSRSVLHLPAAVVCDDEGAEEVREILLVLTELVQRRSPAAAGVPFWPAVEEVARQYQSHPALRGLALVLLEMEGRLPPGALAERLRCWLSLPTEAADNARLVAGLFSLHRSSLLRNRPLVAAVTAFLEGLSLEQLLPLLPWDLGTAERLALTETLQAVLGRTGPASSRDLSGEEISRLREADAAVAATLARWEERYGIA